MKKVSVLGIGVVLAVAGIVAAAAWGLGGSAKAMPPSVFRVTITNMSDPPATLSAGALVAHCADGAFWSEGGSASAEIQAIAELGDPSVAVAVEQEETAMGMTFLQERYAIGEVGPGESVSVEEVFQFGCKLSTAQQIVGSEDSFVGANSVGMWNPETHLPLERVEVALMAYDAGTMSDGAATTDLVTTSGEWTGLQAILTIEFLDPVEEDDEAMSESPMADDSLDDDSMGEDSIDDDSMEDDSMGEDEPATGELTLPNTGSGGLVERYSGAPSIVAYTLAALVLVGLGAGLAGFRQRSRQRR